MKEITNETKKIVTSLIAQHFALKDTMNGLSEHDEEIKTKLKQIMSEHDVTLLEDEFDNVVKNIASSRETFDKKLLRETYGDTIEKFVSKKDFTSMRFFKNGN